MLDLPRGVDIEPWLSKIVALPCLPKLTVTAPLRSASPTPSRSNAPLRGEDADPYGDRPGVVSNVSPIGSVEPPSTSIEPRLPNAKVKVRAGLRIVPLVAVSRRLC